MRDPADPFRIEAVRAWLSDRALPLWAGPGLDSAGSVETLGFDGGPGASPFKRTRVQARQVYALGQGPALGFSDGRDASEECWRYLETRCRRDDGAYVRLTNPDGSVRDKWADAYDMAFVLFALATRSRIEGSEAPAEARALMDVYDELLFVRRGEGWRAAEDRPDERLQNPHMHLLEAALELAETNRDERFAEVAWTVLKLFRERMFDEKRQFLVEAYDANWKPVRGEDQRVEPGHLLEWVWLLGRAKAVLGEDMIDYAAALYGTAERIGLDEHARVFDGLDGEGLEPAATFRIWPQTEAIKAHLAMLEHGGRDTRGRIQTTMDLLLDRYLDAPVAGGWIDQFGDDWRVLSADIPASILYHLVQAFSELFRLESRLANGGLAAKPAPSTERRT